MKTKAENRQTKEIRKKSESP